METVRSITPTACWATLTLSSRAFIAASKCPKKEQTERILKAIKNPYTTIIGHMTGRQLQRRPGYEVDIDKILKACAEYGVAVEINAHPWRLDLDWRWHQKALDYGCIFSINPDAHSIRELDHMHWGVEMARKGGVPPDRVLNAMTLAKLLRHLQRRRQSASARPSVPVKRATFGKQSAGLLLYRHSQTKVSKFCSVILAVLSGATRILHRGLFQKA